MSQKILIIYVGREGRFHSAHLELARSPKTADSVIRKFVTLIRTLPRAERKLWNTAARRDFNIGIQAALRPHSYEIPLATETIESISNLKARIVVTVYAAEMRKNYRRISTNKSLLRMRAMGRRR